MSSCKSCCSESSRKWREKNREKDRERKRRYAMTHKDKVDEYQRLYRAAHADKRHKYNRQWRINHADEERERCRKRKPKDPEKTRDRQRQWRLKNIERLAERSRRYQAEHPERGRETTRRYRSNKHRLPCSFNSNDEARAIEYWHGCCAVCGRPLRDLFNEHYPAMDHWIPLSDPRPDNPGTVPWNMVPLCHGVGGCNNSKRNYDPAEWLRREFGPHKAKEIQRRMDDFFEWAKKPSKEE